MTRTCARRCAVLLAALGVGGGVGRAEEIVRGAGAQLVEAVEVGPVAEATRLELALRASELTGVDAAAMTVVRADLVDHMPLGDRASESEALAVRVHGVSVAYPDAGGRCPAGTRDDVDMVLVFDRADRHLMVAYTSPRSEWILPGSGARYSDAWPRIQEIWGGPRPLGPVALRLGVADVLACVWAHDIRPSDAGQIVMRPRIVSDPWPAQHGAAGGADGAGDEVVWIVDVRGVITEMRPGEQPPYWSGRVFVINDANGASITSFKLH